jgi:hypothetical protein
MWTEENLFRAYIIVGLMRHSDRTESLQSIEHGALSMKHGASIPSTEHRSSNC